MLVNKEVATSEKSLPFKIELEGISRVEDFIAYYKSNENELNQTLLEAGAILFRNTGIDSVETFSQAVDEMAEEFVSYKDGFSPRTKLTSNVYTSTEYDADFFITLHNELSFSSSWPSKLIFCCTIPASTGGETPIADCRKVLSSLDPALAEEFERKGVKYVRNLHGGGGVGPSWQETYETNDQGQVEEFCKHSDIQYEWKDDGGLKIIQYRPAVVSHPITQEKVWFNQVDQFHPSQFEKEIYETLMMMSDGNEQELPMFGSFGDDSSIPVEAMEAVRNTVNEVSVANPWQKSDLVLVDNVLVSHGRNPYQGDRKVLVAMTK